MEGDQKSMEGGVMETRPKGGGGAVEQSMGVRADVPGPGDDSVEGCEIGVLSAAAARRPANI
jgi:hypothetical protein